MTSEDREIERQENEALKSAKEIVKKKTKNKVQKIIWNAVKAAIIPMLILMAKVMAVAILVCVVISMFQSILDGDDADSEKEELLETEISTSIDGNYVVCIGQENSVPELTKEQLKTAIENKYTGQAKENYLGVLDDLIYIQDTYNVNAVFAIAVAQIESGGGTGWGAIAPETYNWMSVTGSYKGQSYKNPNSSNPLTWRVYDSFNTATRDFGDLIANGENYFKAGNYSVSLIAVSYCPPGDEWANSVENTMKAIYEKAGVQISSTNSSDTKGGNEGYDSDEGVTTFTVGNKTYKNYKQINPAYKNVPLAIYPSDNLYNMGCGIVSVTIIATGYGHDVNPIDVNKYYDKYLTDLYHTTALSNYTGKRCTYVYTNIRGGIIEQLNKGYPVLVHVGINSGRFSTTYGHFFTILSISPNGDMIYVSDPASNNLERNSWLPISILNDTAFDKYIKME